VKKNIIPLLAIFFLIACSQQKESTPPTPKIQNQTNTNSGIQEENNYSQRRELHKIANGLLRKDSIKFREANKKVIQLSVQANDSSLLASAYWDLGYHFSRHSKIDSSYYYYLNAQKIYQNLKETRTEGTLLYFIALLQSKAKDYRASEVSTIKAIESFKQIDSTEFDLFRCYNNLGSVTNALNEFDRALDYYNKALEYQKKIKKSNTYNLSVLNNIGNVNRDKKDYNEAIEIYKKVLNTDSLLFNEPRFYAKVLDNLAYTKFKKGDTLDIESQLLKSLKIRDSLNDNSGLSVSHYNLAEFYLHKKDTSKSLRSAKKSEHYSLIDKNNKRLLQTYDLLTRIDPKNATDYAHKYIILNDSLVNEERSLQEKFTRIKFETDEVIGEKEVLEKQKQLLISFVIGALLLAFAVFVIGSQYIKNQKLKFEQEQQETNLETFNLMLAQKGKLVQAKQEEQQRISQELHDGVIGSLTGIALILKATNKKADEETIKERLDLIKQLQETSEEIRTISHTLSAASFKKIQNFTNSIQELLANTSKSSNIETKFTFDAKIDWDQLSAEIKINLYRILQEGIQNSVKYSKAENITLDFSMKKSNLSVFLSDNGIGFNTQKKKKGIGHKNIYSRIVKINADINISSEIGKGTKISITIPLHTSEIITTNEA